MKMCQDEFKMFQLKRVNEDYNKFFSLQDNTNEWRLSMGKEKMRRKEGYQQGDKKQEAAPRNVMSDLRTKIVQGKERHPSN
jgi:hypothetical protein